MGIPPATLASFALDFTNPPHNQNVNLRPQDAPEKSQMLLPPPSASTWQIHFVPIQLNIQQFITAKRKTLFY